LDLHEPHETVVDTEVGRVVDSDRRSSPGLFHLVVDADWR
jgi:hypothetical protein